MQVNDGDTQPIGENEEVVEHFLSRAQVEDRLGLKRGSASRIKLPKPDVTVGPIEPDGSLAKGTVRGWRLETIDKWMRSRPGRGARTDLDVDDD